MGEAARDVGALGVARGGLTPMTQPEDDAQALARAPGALLCLSHGATFGETERHGVVEIKTAFSCLVVRLEPEAVLLSDEVVERLAGFDHLTVHRNLMVHARGPSGIRELMPATIANGSLIDSAVHLVSVSVPPTGVAASIGGRHQKKYGGGIPVLPFAPDEAFNSAATHLIVDLWASQAWFEAPAFLPPIRQSCRPAISYSGSVALGPVPSSWAFRDGTPPPCALHFRFWYAEYPELAVQTIHVPRSMFRIDPASRPEWVHVGGVSTEHSGIASDRTNSE